MQHCIFTATYKYLFSILFYVEKKKVNIVILLTGILFCFLLGFFLSTGFSAITGNAMNVYEPPSIPSSPGSAPPTCSDGIRNQDESDVDCGGVCVQLGKKCALDKECVINVDCATDYCPVSTCKIKPTPQMGPLMTKEPNFTAFEEEKKTIVQIPESILTPSISPNREPVTHAVSIVRRGAKFEFDPNRIIAFPGDQLIIINKDTIPHQPVSIDRIFEGSKLSPGEEAKLQLNNPGEFVINDDMNPSTQGYWQDFKLVITIKTWEGSCSDGIKNLDETDVDCGGHCPACVQGKSCNLNRDCLTALCKKNVCTNPEPVSCFDELKNQDETDVDCGGSCLRKCPDGQNCLLPKDCMSNYCNSFKLCLTPSCTDNEKNQDESDVDCGGSRCKKCIEGKACQKNEDCVTEVCTNQRCDIKTYNFQMTAKQFDFVPNTIIVEQGSRVKINITSADVNHGFMLKEFSVQKEINSKSSQMVEFIADKFGTFEFVCSVMCGSGHANMRGKLIVEEKKAPTFVPEQPTIPIIETISTPVKKTNWILLILFLIVMIISVAYYFGYYTGIKKVPLPKEKRDVILDYVNSMRQKGYGDEQIYEKLLSHGHDKKDIEKYLRLPKEKLLDYVKRMLRLGHKKNQIMAELLDKGYSPIEIHDALERTRW